MNFDDRLSYLLIGCLIGFFLGYVIRHIQTIEKEIDDIMGSRKSETKSGNGSYINNVALLMVVLLTTFAAVSSQKATNGFESTQDQLARTTSCDQQFLTKTISTLNERAEFTTNRAVANINLQKEQAQFLKVAVLEDVKTSTIRASLTSYLNSLNRYVEASSKYSTSRRANPYPTTSQLKDCIINSKEIK